MAEALVMRLRVRAVQETKNNDGKFGERVELDAVYDANHDSPNYSFSAATPSATLTAYISNPRAYDFFTPGREYDVVLSPRRVVSVGADGVVTYAPDPFHVAAI